MAMETLYFSKPVVHIVLTESVVNCVVVDCVSPDILGVLPSITNDITESGDLLAISVCQGKPSKRVGYS